MEKKEISMEERERNIHDQLREMVAGGCEYTIYDYSPDNSIEFRAYCDASMIFKASS